MTLVANLVRTVNLDCAAGLADAHPGSQSRILLKNTRIENAHKVRK